MNENQPGSFEDAYSLHKESANELEAARGNKQFSEELLDSIDNEADLDDMVGILDAADQRVRGAEEDYRRVLDENAAMVTPELIESARAEMDAALQKDTTIGQQLEMKEHPKEAKQTPEAALRADFERVMGSKWEKLPEGIDLTTKLPGVNALSFVGPRVDRGVPAWLLLKSWDPETGGNFKIDSLSLTRDGMLLGRMPASLREKGVTKDDMLRELIGSVEKLNPQDWIVLGIDILPPEKMDEPREINEAALPSKKEHAHPIDPERLENLQKYPGFITGFVGERSYRSYYGLLFRDFAVLEHPQKGNAAFVFDLREPIDPSTIPTDEKERAQWLASQPWIDLIRQGRKAFAEKTQAEKIVHKGDWKGRMQQEIETRLGRTNA